MASRVARGHLVVHPKGRYPVGSDALPPAVEVGAEIVGADPDRVRHPSVRQLALVTEPVHGGGGDPKEPGNLPYCQ